MLKLKNYTSKILKKSNNEDVKNLQKLLEECFDFFILTSGEKPRDNEAELTLEMLPQQKTLKDKFVIGFFEDKKIFHLLI